MPPPKGKSTKSARIRPKTKTSGRGIAISCRPGQTNNNVATSRGGRKYRKKRRKSRKKRPKSRKKRRKSRKLRKSRKRRK